MILKISTYPEKHECLPRSRFTHSVYDTELYDHNTGSCNSSYFPVYGRLWPCVFDLGGQSIDYLDIRISVEIRHAPKPKLLVLGFWLWYGFGFDGLVYVSRYFEKHYILRPNPKPKLLVLVLVAKYSVFRIFRSILRHRPKLSKPKPYQNQNLKTKTNLETKTFKTKTVSKPKLKTKTSKLVLVLVHA